MLWRMTRRLIVENIFFSGVKLREWMVCVVCLIFFTSFSHKSFSFFFSFFPLHHKISLVFGKPLLLHVLHHFLSVIFQWLCSSLSYWSVFCLLFASRHIYPSLISRKVDAVVLLREWSHIDKIAEDFKLWLNMNCKSVVPRIGLSLHPPLTAYSVKGGERRRSKYTHEILKPEA